MRVVCVLCEKVWTKEPFDQPALLSHGICTRCEGLHDRYMDGEVTLEKARADARKPPLVHAPDGLFH